MKINALLIFSMIWSISLFSRENPFEPTDHFLEQKEMIVEANKQAQNTENEEKKAKKKLEESAKALIEEKKQEKSLPTITTQVKKIQTTVNNTKEKELVEPKKVTLSKTQQSFNILPFIKIDITNDILTIQVDTKYKFLNQKVLRPAKKLLFDFEGNVSFYTVRKDILSKKFISLIVGTHMKENYFRIVIDLPSKTTNYIENIDSKKGIITISTK